MREAKVMNNLNKRPYMQRYELKKARRRAGLTLREVAEKIHYSPQTISMAEQGKIYLDDESEASIAFFSVLQTLYGVPREILRKRGR